jgi:hypothetical protein
VTRREDDKRGSSEFGDDPNAQHYEKIEARFNKEWRAKSGRDHQGRDVFPKGKMNTSHREDVRDKKGWRS